MCVGKDLGNRMNNVSTKLLASVHELLLLNPMFLSFVNVCIQQEASQGSALCLPLEVLYIAE